MRSRALSGVPKTVAVRRSDLQVFLTFFKKTVGRDRIVHWTREVSEAFRKELVRKRRSSESRFAGTTVNRILGTVRKLARWVHERRPFEPDHPMAGVRGVPLPRRTAEWKSLSPAQILAMKRACHRRLKTCWKGTQDPDLEGLVFFLLLETGLRESELVELDYRHLGEEGLEKVSRLGEDWAFPLSSEAWEWVRAYLERRGRAHGPLLISRRGTRLAAQDIRRLCHRLSEEACRDLPSWKQYRINPRDLRDTFLTRVLQEHGRQAAQAVSGSAGPSTVNRLLVRKKKSPAVSWDDEILREAWF